MLLFYRRKKKSRREIRLSLLTGEKRRLSLDPVGHLGSNCSYTTQFLVHAPQTPHSPHQLRGSFREEKSILALRKGCQLHREGPVSPPTSCGHLGTLPCYSRSRLNQVLCKFTSRVLSYQSKDGLPTWARASQTLAVFPARIQEYRTYTGYVRDYGDPRPCPCPGSL